MFQVLDERQLEHFLKLAEKHLKMQVWKYNGKCYLKRNDKQLIDKISINLMKTQMVTLNKLIVLLLMRQQMG